MASSPSPSLKLADLLARLQKDYSEYNFKPGSRFAFRPPKTIIVGPDEDQHTPLLLFHELGHALSKKYSYCLSIERLKIESLAWQTGKEAYLACQSSGNYPSLPPWDDEFVEDNLDTYRDWLHQKSTCKSCGLTMYQDSAGWHCPYCSQFKS